MSKPKVVPPIGKIQNPYERFVDELMRKTAKRTGYTIEVNYSAPPSKEYWVETKEAKLFDKAVGFPCQSTGYGPGYRNVTYYFKDLVLTTLAFKRAIKVARKLIRAGSNVQVQIHALMR